MYIGNQLDPRLSKDMLLEKSEDERKDKSDPRLALTDANQRSAGVGPRTTSTQGAVAVYSVQRRVRASSTYPVEVGVGMQTRSLETTNREHQRWWTRPKYDEGVTLLVEKERPRGFNQMLKTCSCDEI